MLEKHDRAQNEIYRLQSRVDTTEADRARLEVEAERSTLGATKAREDLRKLQDESSRLQEACDRIALQLTRAKELEDKAREELEINRERLEKAQSDLRKSQADKDLLQAEVERLTYEVDRGTHTNTKASAALESALDESKRLSLEVDKMRDRYEKAQSELRRLQEQETYGRESRRFEDENKRLRERLDKALIEYEALKSKAVYDEESFLKYKEKFESRELEWQNLETKLHETTLQLELSKGEVTKLINNQEKQRAELERAHIECEKVRDRHEKLIKEAERMRQLGPNAKPSNAISPSTTNALSQSPAERSENERLRDRLEKALQVNQLLYNFLEKHTQNQFGTRDATELEAGRLAKELEKAQMHLAKQQEANESTRIEFERMSAELNRYQERLERSEAERETLKQSTKHNAQAQEMQKNIAKLDTEAKQLAAER